MQKTPSKTPTRVPKGTNPFQQAMMAKAQNFSKGNSVKTGKARSKGK